MNLQELMTLLDGYGELRYQINSNSQLVMSNGTLVQNSTSENKGFSARILKGSSWGFASTSQLNIENIKRTINQAQNNANFLNVKQARADLLLPSRPIKLERDLSTKKKKLSSKEKIEIITELSEYVKNKYKDLANISLVIRDDKVEKNVITADGSVFKTVIPRGFIFCNFMMQNGAGMITEGCQLGGLGEFEDYHDKMDEFYEKIEEAYGHLINKKSAVFAESGVHDVILDSNLAGILAHEAIGHTTEADIVRGGSIMEELMGKQVASEIVNLIDVPHTYKGQLCPRPVFVDDEGVEAVTANIIENGILKSFMHNKGSALSYGVAPTGNARASQYSDEPIIRMRNTMIVPGREKLEDMIKTIKDGYYLINPNNGEADKTSEFMFGIVRGYQIKDGKIAKAIKETTISGIAVNLLKTITAISDDLTWIGSGTCGKKQGTAVGMGGPAIKCKVNIGGK